MSDDNLSDILKNLRTVYQPIVDLNSGRFVALEALSRGEPGSDYESPLAILALFNEKKATEQFDIESHTRALRNFKKSASPVLLFLNIENITMLHNIGHMERLNEELEAHGFNKSDIVLEVCERFYDMDIQDRIKCFKRYTDCGYALALDDIDSSMLAMTDVILGRWSYVKLSARLVRDIDKSADKRAFVKSMIAFTKYKRIRVIAEGVETTEELKTLIDLQVDFAQGFLIGGPEEINIERDPGIEELIRDYQKNRHKTAPEEFDYKFVGQLMEKREGLAADMKCRDVLERFQDTNYDSICFLNNTDMIAGYITKSELYRVFSTQFGYSLYGNKPIQSLFNGSPLIVNYHTPIKLVLEAGMSREERHIYDDIIVANNGKYLGIVSMQRVINAYNEQDTRKATQLNPLTALPGNNIINNNIRKFMENDVRVLFAYADLSDFKAYNDFYGFESGDAVIRRTAEILTTAFGAMPFNSFVGHIGGDDFVCMCEVPDDHAGAHHMIKETLAGIIEAFEKAKVGFYTQTDFNLGFITACNRHGKYAKTALTNINIACYYGKLRRFDTLENFAEYIAGVKRLSKQKPYSNYIVKFEKDNNVIDFAAT